MTTRGFVLGKFLPPHRGHQYLGEFARNYCDELTILVCSLDREPISGHLRHAWMCEMFPTVRVLHLHRDVPQEPHEDPNFWSIWRGLVREFHPEPIDYVFASEHYGHRLALELSAQFVPVDPGRETVPISGSAIRADPFRHWRYLARPVRQYFLKKVCVFGPESTGKSTLVKEFARTYETSYVPEYGRIFTDNFGVKVDTEGLRRIQLGHNASTKAAMLDANRVLFLDTDPILTCVWSDMLLGHRDGIAHDELCDLYLLTGVDVPWVDDGTRYFPDDEQRLRFFEICKSELISRRANFVELHGGWRDRWRDARKAVDHLLACSYPKEAP
jgi:HTH-type transcriptional repressor of NAD biosynthesis genes